MAISFAIFAIALSKLLFRASSGMKTIQTAAGKMESKLDGTLHALEGTMDEAEGTMKDLEAKIHALNSVFLSAEQLGDAANVLGGELDELTKDYADTEGAPGAKPFIRVIQGAESAKGLLKAWKRGKAIYVK